MVMSLEPEGSEREMLFTLRDSFNCWMNHLYTMIVYFLLVILLGQTKHAQYKKNQKEENSAQTYGFGRTCPRKTVLDIATWRIIRKETELSRSILVKVTCKTIYWAVDGSFSVQNNETSHKTKPVSLAVRQKSQAGWNFYVFQVDPKSKFRHNYS